MWFQLSLQYMSSFLQFWIFFVFPPLSIFTDNNESSSGILFRKMKNPKCFLSITLLLLFQLPFFFYHKCQILCLHSLLVAFHMSHHYTVFFNDLASFILLILLLSIITQKHIADYLKEWENLGIQKSSYFLSLVLRR